MENKETKVAWFFIVLFYAVAVLISAPFNTGIFESYLIKHTHWNFLKDYSYLPAGFGPAIATAVVLFLNKKHIRTISFLGNSAFKNLVISMVPLLVFTITGINNHYQQNTHLWAFIFSFINLIYAIMEESGWRFYLQDALLPINKNLRFLFVGILWWVWHFRFNTSFDFTWFLVICIVSSYLIGNFTQQSKSLLTAAGFHSFIILLSNSGELNWSKIIAGIVTIISWLLIGTFWKNSESKK